MTPLAITTHPNIEKFLFLITSTEGTDRQGTPYNELFGFSNFTDFSTHPNIRVTKNGYTSTAAGRYQILKGTYDSLRMKDFSPASQDKAAIQLIKNAGAYNDVIKGDFQNAIRKTNKIWASLPLSPYGQPTWTMNKALQFLGKNPAPVFALIVAVSIIVYLTYKK